MSWFDESDDDESENEAPKNQDQNNTENEVDPLDAFMANLSSTSQANDEKKKNQQASIERLNYENEEEATSHWEISSLSRKDRGMDDSIDNKKDEFSIQTDVSSTTRHTSNSSKVAAASLSSTFHRAGEALSASGDKISSKVSSGNTTNNRKNALEQNHDSSDSDTESAIKKRNRTIDPLDAVDHSQIEYHPFRRTFYDQTTNTECIIPLKWRSEHSISVTSTGSSYPCSLSPILSPFISPPLSNLLPQTLLKFLTNQNLHKPTLVQAQTFPIALAGHDVIVTASTGSGKTYAYLIPMIIHCLDQPHIQPNKDGPIGIILVPTRELATQIYSHAYKMMKKVGGNVVAVTGGGKGRYELSKDLRKGCEIVVSTPGRLIDMLKGREDKAPTNLRRVTMVVLDEADRMLEMGFESQVTSILRNVRVDRHMMMLSATFGRRVEKVAESWLQDPIRIAIGKTGISSSHVTQHVIKLPSPSSKITWLTSMLPTLAPLGKVIIFVASRDACERILQSIRQQCSLGNAKINAESIHGDKHQHDRNAALRQFARGQIETLVATDVASRGLDVKDVMTVINFDVAKNLDIHTHRIGRAGRMSASDSKGEQQYQKGIAYTLMTRKDADFANLLMENFVKEGRAIENELKDLASYSKFYGRYAGGGTQKKRVHGIGWNRDDFQKSNDSDLPLGKNIPTTRKNSNSTTKTGNDPSYYGPSISNKGNGEMQTEKDRKRRRWG